MPALPALLALPDPDQQDQQDQKAPSYPFGHPDSLPIAPTDQLNHLNDIDLELFDLFGHKFEWSNISTWPTPFLFLYIVTGLVIFAIHARRFRVYINGPKLGSTLEEGGSESGLGLGSGMKRPWGRWGWGLSDHRVLLVGFAMCVGMYLVFWPLFLGGGWVVRRFRSKSRGFVGGGLAYREERGAIRSGMMMSPPPPYGVATMGVNTAGGQMPLPQSWASRYQTGTTMPMAPALPNQGRTRMVSWLGLTPTLTPVLATASRLASPPSYTEATSRDGSGGQKAKSS